MISPYLSKSEEDTKDFAGELLRKNQDTLCRRALLFALQGELGTGKTVFAKGVGEHLGIRKPVRSPGYVLVSEYPYSCSTEESLRRKTLRVKRPKPEGLGNAEAKELMGKFYHVDLWRIEDEAEAKALGIEEMIRPGNIVLIEWAQKVPNLMRELEERDDLEVVKLEFAHKSEEEREVRISN